MEHKGSNCKHSEDTELTEKRERKKKNKTARKQFLKEIWSAEEEEWKEKTKQESLDQNGPKEGHPEDLEQEKEENEREERLWKEKEEEERQERLRKEKEKRERQERLQEERGEKEILAKVQMKARTQTKGVELCRVYPNFRERNSWKKPLSTFYFKRVLPPCRRFLIPSPIPEELEPPEGWL